MEWIEVQPWTLLILISFKVLGKITDSSEVQYRKPKSQNEDFYIQKKNVFQFLSPHLEYVEIESNRSRSRQNCQSLTRTLATR